MEKGCLEGLHEYVQSTSLRESQVLKELRFETDKDPSSIMQIPATQGQFMSLLVKLIGAKRSIEIGVYTGYSALCVAEAMPDDSYTVACDVDEQWAEKAKAFWKKAGVDYKIDFRLAPAIETLESLLQDGQAGSYDFIFIDADKDNYDTYYELSLRLLRKGGLIAIDNVLLFGSVVDYNALSEAMKDMLPESSVQAVRDLNEKIHNDSRVDMSMLQIADGLSLIRKI
ncbi:class I SAM-dependent methyltransferase [Agaribacterium sp. ZY112]|uniref:class I SAM-dependent methyltransferase n=1 Tax=Agaribacterium sp. ZY112 TaxID=3233574 RepID=UPI00352400D1